jgi:hypothetical protein
VTAELSSARREVPDALAAIELYFEQGWTDGLPVVPPTEPRVREFLEQAGREPGDVLGVVRNRSITVTAEKVAINAVMAGCLPTYFPVVLTAVEALLDERFNAHGSMASTAGAAPLLVVNGPLASEIGLNAGDNVFGPGWRANATIGRALRLILLNVLQARPGIMDKSTLGHPGKYSYCLAELEQDSGWDPLHVERGLTREQNAVTLFAAEAPAYVKNDEGNTPEQLANSLVDTITRGTPRQAHLLLVVCPEHLAVYRRAGWSKRDLRAYVAEHAVRTLASAKRAGWKAGPLEPADESTLLRWFARPDQLLVVVAGGRTSGTSAVIPPWAGGASSDPVTRPIEVQA